MSINASTAGLRVLRLILGMKPKDAGAELTTIQPYLTYDEDQKAFDFIRGHYVSHGVLPHPDTVLETCSVFLPPSHEPFAFERQQLKNRFIEDAMRAASDLASAQITEGKPEDALKLLIANLMPITQSQTAHALFDFRDTKESAFAFYKEQLKPFGVSTPRFGYPTLDKQGGQEDGDMIGIVGRPGSGKTWLMLSFALKFWAEYQEPVLFVTQEMSSKQIEKRLLPMVAGVNPTPLYRGEAMKYELNGLTHEGYLKKLEWAAHYVRNKGTVPFLIYDSKMAGTVADIEQIAAMHGIKQIYIDGAYMLRHPDLRLGRYMRVPENLDLLKYFCQRTGARVTSSWQFKKGTGKGGAEERPDIDDIGYSHAIAEYMGVILGLLENPKSISQMDKKTVDVMKGRNGEVATFPINWRFSDSNFDEVALEDTEADLVYL